MENSCYKCGEKRASELQNMFGYMICNKCKSKMGLFQDKTIKKYVSSFAEAKKIDPKQPSFAEEMSKRLTMIEKDYISKKIKLLFIQERLKEIQ